MHYYTFLQNDKYLKYIVYKINMPESLVFTTIYRNSLPNFAYTSQLGEKPFPKCI